MSSVCRRLRGIFTTKVPSKSRANLSEKPLPQNASTTETHFQRLVHEFKKSCESHRFRSNQGIYRRTVARLAAAKMFSMVEDILEHQKKYDDISKEGFAIRLISLYGKSGMFEHAHKVFDELPELRCERTVASFNALLKAGVESKKFDEVFEIFKELPSKVSIEPDLVSYNIIINAFCEKGSFDDALSMLHELENNGKVPDRVTFNTVLNALYRTGQFSEGERIWAMMESKNVIPDVRSYNPRLRGMIRDGKLSEAAQLIDEMESKEINPDVFTYNGLIKGFSDGGNLVEAKKWYGELQKNKCTPDLVTYELLIPLCSEAADLDKAFELCLEAINHRVRLSAVVFKRVVDELVKQDKTEEASELVALVNSAKFLKYKLELTKLPVVK